MAIKKMREIATEERNIKIENMGLNELKRFLCMKNLQKPEKCRDCPGKKNCRAGQRAIVLLDEMEKQKMEEQMKEQQTTKPVVEAEVKRTRQELTEKRRQIFIAALQSPDMVQYMIDNNGNNKNSARQRLAYWGRVYPDIAEQYNFWEMFSGVKKDMPAYIRSHKDVRRYDAINRFKEALSQPDPIQFMMEKYGIDRTKAVHNYGQWKRRYGDIVKEDQLVKEVEVHVNVEAENDEVSVEDFLKEVNAVAEEKHEDPVLVKADPVFTKADGFYGELNAKFYELEKEKASLTERIAWIEKAQEALVTTAKIFNGNATFPSGR